MSRATFAARKVFRMNWLLPILCAVASLGFFAAAAFAERYFGVYVALGSLFFLITAISARRV